MCDMADRPHHELRNETPLERADRNFAELLQEVRVTQAGVQILFAFLLTLAFTQRFPDIDAFQRTTYVVTLLLSMLAAVLFTAPAALHRSLFQQNAKPVIVQVSSRLASAGLAVLMLAFTGSVLLVVDVTLGRAAGIAAAREPWRRACCCGGPAAAGPPHQRPYGPAGHGGPHRDARRPGTQVLRGLRGRGLRAEGLRGAPFTGPAGPRAPSTAARPRSSSRPPGWAAR